MSAPDSESNPTAVRGRSRNGFSWLGAGLVLSLGLNAYEWIQLDHQSRELMTAERSLRDEITRVSDAMSAAFDVDQQRFQQMHTAVETASASSLRQARPQDESTSELAQELEQKQELLSRELAELKQSTNSELKNTNSRLQNTNARLDSTTAKVDTTSAKLDQVSTALSHATLSAPASPVSAVSAVPKADARVSVVSLDESVKDEPTPQANGGRESFRLDLIRDKTGQTFGDVRVVLLKSDPKRAVFTLDLFVGDKMTEKRDQPADTPVKVYVSGSSEPYEIVIQQIKADEVIGYLQAPKAKNQKSGKRASL